MHISSHKMKLGLWQGMYLEDAGNVSQIGWHPLWVKCQSIQEFLDLPHILIPGKANSNLLTKFAWQPSLFERNLF